eukprot:1141135-Pelagomonas_calceolata.AAC.7
MQNCACVILQVERLASGLSHEPSVVVARLNVAAQGNKLSETSQFVGGVLGEGGTLWQGRLQYRTVAVLHGNSVFKVYKRSHQSRRMTARLKCKKGECKRGRGIAAWQQTVQQLPTLLLYPEASPGVMRYQDVEGCRAGLVLALLLCFKSLFATCVLPLYARPLYKLA